MSTVLELADDTYQQCTVLAEQEHRTPDTMRRLYLLAYEHYPYHLMHQQMAVEGLLETAPALPALTKVPDEEEDVEPEAMPGTSLSDIILEDRW